MDTIISTINTLLGVAMFILYLYQFYYIFVAITRKPKQHDSTDRSKRYAFLIAARNEENVIANLLRSIENQDYPSDNIDIYVVADNCTDKTADISRECGARVFERFDTKNVGKGYALNFLLKKISSIKGIRYYSAYFVFDADNILEPDYVTEMDKTFSAGSRVITSYRNSKNYGQSWIASGYALWFLREAKYINNSRSLLGVSGAVSGTGFMVSSDVFESNNGWKHHLLTEDIEFSVDMIIRGEVIGYCHTAMFYDEQPTTFRQSWRQRLRWAKGFLQVYHNYGLGLFLGIFKKNAFSCFDMSMSIMPAFFFAVGSMIVNWSAAIFSLVKFGSVSETVLYYCFHFLIISYCLMFVLGLFTLISERRRIHCRLYKAILHLFLFPVFMMSYIPISVTALFSKVEWKQISHSVSVSIEDMKKTDNMVN